MELSILRDVCKSSVPSKFELIVRLGVSATGLTVILKSFVTAWLSAAPLSVEVTLAVIVVVPE